MSRKNRYKAWWQMKERCLNPKHPFYASYGGRGITVDPAWMDFETYYEDTGEPPEPGLTLDRMDNDGPYSPENCRWTTKAVQSQNRRNRTLLTYKGETLLAAEWSRRTGIAIETILWRKKQGWPDSKTLTKDPKKYSRGKQLTYKGQTKSVSEWSKMLGIKPTTIHDRLYRGWTVEAALEK